MAREDGISPSQAFFGRRQRQILPLRASELIPQHIDISQKDKLASDQSRRRNQHTKQFDPLEIGQEYWLQHHSSVEWYTTAVILSQRE